MLSMIKTLQLFKKESPVVSRELAQDQYMAGDYLVGKLLAELPLDALVGGFFAWLLHGTAGLESPRFPFVGTLSLLACATSTLGLAVGSFFGKGDTALAVGPA